MRLPKSKAVYATLGALIALVGSGATTYGAAYKTVTVQDGGQRKTLRGFGTGTLGQFLQAHGVQINQRDRVSPSIDSPIASDMTVNVLRPKRITLNFKGKPVQISTFANSVGELLKDQGISLSDTEYLNVSRNSKLTAGERISIHSTSEKVSTKTQPIPFHTVRRHTDKLQVGHQHVVTHGVKGKLQVKTTSVFEDGRKISQDISKKVIRKPTNAVVDVGTRTAVHHYALSSRGDVPDGNIVEKRMTVLATAYTAGGLTASGRPAQPGVIAVDPRVIPLGTHVYIPGIGNEIAADTGGMIIGRHIDICMPTRAAAEQWGARTITIDILQ